MKRFVIDGVETRADSVKLEIKSSGFQMPEILRTDAWRFQGFLRPQSIGINRQSNANDSSADSVPSEDIRSKMLGILG